MKRFFTVFFLLLSFTFNACAADSDRIVSLAPAITEIVFALNSGDRLVGVTDYCDFPPEADQIESIGGFITPSLEKIISLNPDLVLLSPNAGTKAVQERLSVFGVTNHILKFYSINDLRESFLRAGDLLERNDEAAALVSELDETIRETASMTSERNRPSVLLVRSHIPLFVAGKSTYEDDIITASGGVNAVKSSTGRYPQFTKEKLMLMNPDIIIDGTHYDSSKGQISELTEFWKRFSFLDAVKNEKVFFIEGDVHSVPGPRTAEFIRIVRSVLYPDLFSVNPDLACRLGVGDSV